MNEDLKEKLINLGSILTAFCIFMWATAFMFVVMPIAPDSAWSLPWLLTGSVLSVVFAVACGFGFRHMLKKVFGLQ